MSWDRKGRSRSRFFYLSVRVGGRVKKVYVGKGPKARAAAQILKERKEAWMAARIARQRIMEQTIEADRLLGDFIREVNVLTAATMLVAGWHNHKGQWRRRRDDRNCHTA